MEILGCILIFAVGLAITLSPILLSIESPWAPICIFLGMGWASFGTTYYKFWIEAWRAGMTTRDYILHGSRGDI